MENGVLTIPLKGRVDSNNVETTEEQIDSCISQNQPFDKLMLDIKDLDYISSAGLRMLLKLKKSLKDIKLVNVSKDVYEIFEMTGFSEILDLERALRKIDIEGKEILGQGAFGIVYRIDPETIVKVYQHSSKEEVKKLAQVAKKAFLHGIPTAISYDLVESDGKYGAVFELIHSDTPGQRADRESRPAE